MKNKLQVRHGIDRSGRKKVTARGFLNSIDSYNTGSVRVSCDVDYSHRKGVDVSIQLDISDCSRKASLDFSGNVHDPESFHELKTKLKILRDTLDIIDSFIEYATTVEARRADGDVEDGLE